MLNQVILVGRITKDVEVRESENGKKRAYVTVAVPRSYKNEEGKYDTDFIECILWNDVAENTSKYCKKGDIIGVKGRLQTDNYEKEGTKIYKLSVVAEKVTFLQTKREDEVNE